MAAAQGQITRLVQMAAIAFFQQLHQQAAAVVVQDAMGNRLLGLAVQAAVVVHKTLTKQAAQEILHQQARHKVAMVEMETGRLARKQAGAVVVQMR